MNYQKQPSNVISTLPSSLWVLFSATDFFLDLVFFVVRTYKQIRHKFSSLMFIDDLDVNGYTSIDISQNGN